MKMSAVAIMELHDECMNALKAPTDGLSKAIILLKIAQLQTEHKWPYDELENIIEELQKIQRAQKDEKNVD